MERFVSGPVACAVLFACVLALAAPAAVADNITGGDLFGVITNNPTGDFSGAPTGGTGETPALVSASAVPGETYTIVHFIEFAPSPPSLFPDALVPQAFPAAFFTPESFGFLPDAEFFLLGALPGLTPDPDHLLLSNASGAAPPNSVPLGSDLHDSLVTGASALVGGDPFRTVSAADFWAQFPDIEGKDAAAAFFDLKVGFGQGPVVQLDQFAFQEGSEDLFGFNPPFFAGSLNGSIGDYTFTDRNGTTTAPIPEPGTLVLVAGALAVGLGLRRRRRTAA